MRAEPRSSARWMAWAAILPDPMARDLFATWRSDFKDMERQFAAMSAG